MKKLIVPTICLLVGCAAGALMPAVTAQWPDSPQAPRWQQECQEVPRLPRGSQLNWPALNAMVRERGEQGWELAVSIDFFSVCFKRPAP